jgi:hypothetical protein
MQIEQAGSVGVIAAFYLGERGCTWLFSGFIQFLRAYTWVEP